MFNRFTILYKLNIENLTVMSRLKVVKQIHKSLSLCHKLKFSNPYIFETQCRRPSIFQTMNSGRSNDLSLKHQRFAPSSCKDIRIRKFEFVTKTQVLFSDIKK